MLPSYDEVLEDDAVIEVGRLGCARSTRPGHTPGSMCFQVEGSPVLFSGDTLFPGGPGATGFPGGDFDTIIRSIDDRLFSKLEPRRHRDAGPRRRHDDRQRAPAPPGVDRPGLVRVALRYDERPGDDTPLHTEDLPPTPVRGPQHPGHRVDRSARLAAAPGRRPARHADGRLQAAHRPVAALAGRPGHAADARYAALPRRRPRRAPHVPPLPRRRPATARARAAPATRVSARGRRTCGTLIVQTPRRVRSLERNAVQGREATVDIGAPEILIILAIVLLLFGAKKVPELARSLGQAQKEFKKGAKEGYATADDETATPRAAAPGRQAGRSQHELDVSRTTSSGCEARRRPRRPAVGLRPSPRSPSTSTVMRPPSSGMRSTRSRSIDVGQRRREPQLALRDPRIEAQQRPQEQQRRRRRPRLRRARRSGSPPAPAARRGRSRRTARAAGRRARRRRRASPTITRCAPRRTRSA